MNILKEVFRNEVFPAMGCTEPVAVALACSLARYALSDGNSKHVEISRVRVTTDPGSFKNGIAVSIPNARGAKGSQVAAALGAICGKPELKLEVLREVTDSDVDEAMQLLSSDCVQLAFDRSWDSLRIEARVESGDEYGIAIIADGHTNVLICRKGESEIIDLSHIFGENNSAHYESFNVDYRNVLRKISFADLIEVSRGIDESDRDYIEKGVAINMKISDAGREMKGVGSQFASLVKKGILSDDIMTGIQIVASSATDARMAGVSLPVMSSGGSGNQGIVAILVPYCYGKRQCIDSRVIQESIALSHLINSYVKCFLGKLSSSCGCAIAAGIGASAAIVYQEGGDIDMIGCAINSVVGDIAGIICDGAKSGCSLKVASAVRSSIRAALFAKDGFSIDSLDGIIGKTPEETIQNLWTVDMIGFQNIDDTILKIMAGK
ncbi:serine dehydratase subunit alpha family protein [Patescibacteria group bacterium]